MSIVNTPTQSWKWVLIIAPRREKTCLRSLQPGRPKPACSATEARWRLDISDIETSGIILSRQRTSKTLIRLRVYHKF